MIWPFWSYPVLVPWPKIRAVVWLVFIEWHQLSNNLLRAQNKYGFVYF
jgi:hypothetical protein